MKRLVLGTLAVLVLGSGGCATHGLFRSYLDAGLYQEAARTFEADSTLDAMQ